jgi:spermidine/putrescine-binding protein
LLKQWIFSFLLLLVCLPCLSSTPRLKLFIWWDFLAPKVITKINNAGYEIETTIYKTNEEALSRVFGQNQYDILVVSNWVMQALASGGFLDRNSLKPIVKKREYVRWLRELTDYCVPYLWSTTTFAYDPRSTKCYQALLIP